MGVGWKIKGDIKRKTQKSASELGLASKSLKQKYITQNIAVRSPRREGGGHIPVRINGRSDHVQCLWVR
jgi:hypothetical protein